MPCRRSAERNLPITKRLQPVHPVLYACCYSGDRACATFKRLSPKSIISPFLYRVSSFPFLCRHGCRIAFWLLHISRVNAPIKPENFFHRFKRFPSNRPTHEPAHPIGIELTLSCITIFWPLRTVHFDHLRQIPRLSVCRCPARPHPFSVYYIHACWTRP